MAAEKVNDRCREGSEGLLLTRNDVVFRSEDVLQRLIHFFAGVRVHGLYSPPREVQKESIHGHARKFNGGAATCVTAPPSGYFCARWFSAHSIQSAMGYRAPSSLSSSYCSSHAMPASKSWALVRLPHHCPPYIDFAYRVM